MLNDEVLIIILETLQTRMKKAYTSSLFSSFSTSNHKVKPKTM